MFGYSSRKTEQCKGGVLEYVERAAQVLTMKYTEQLNAYIKGRN